MWFGCWPAAILWFVLFLARLQYICHCRDLLLNWYCPGPGALCEGSLVYEPEWKSEPCPGFSENVAARGSVRVWLNPIFTWNDETIKVDLRLYRVSVSGNKSPYQYPKPVGIKKIELQLKFQVKTVMGSFIGSWDCSLCAQHEIVLVKSKPVTFHQSGNCINREFRLSSRLVEHLIHPVMKEGIHPYK